MRFVVVFSRVRMLECESRFVVQRGMLLSSSVVANAAIAGLYRARHCLAAWKPLFGSLVAHASSTPNNPSPKSQVAVLVK